MSTPQRPVVIVSNRGPASFSASREEQVTRIRAQRGSGGLVSGLAPLLETGDARWVAAALSEGDRLAARLLAGETAAAPDGTRLEFASGAELAERVELVTMSEGEQSCYYDVISNETLWFINHGLYDLVRSPSFDPDWWQAWDTYATINRRFAERVAAVAPDGAVVLIQDYHLTLVAETLRALRPDLALVHFLHTPFAGPDNLRVLPDAARTRMLRSLSQHDACGFHTTMWSGNFRRCLDAYDINAGDRTVIFEATLSSDVNEIGRTAASAECEEEVRRIDETFGDTRLIVRVDRMELSKNIVRGFEAFDLLLTQRPDLRGRVTFLACCYPSRESVAAYRRYREEVEASATALNERWGDGDWTPVHLETDDNYPRSVAALRRYDVLLVNPIRDGLNLVAKEGPSINERAGQLILSTQAGAWTELQDHALGVNPFDLSATATALAAALDMAAPEREERARALRDAATARTPENWLDDQLRALGG